jgi:hypothetical protein
MQGKRIQTNDKGGLPILKPGEYGQLDMGWWLACTPNGQQGNLGNHDVTEHEDGTITVSPSILIYPAGGDPGWHGYLEHGVWREC